MRPHIILWAYFEGYNISAVYNVYGRNFRKEAKAYRGNKSIFGQIIVVEKCGIVQKSFDICCIFLFGICIELSTLPITEPYSRLSNKNQWIFFPTWKFSISFNLINRLQYDCSWCQLWADMFSFMFWK